MIYNSRYRIELKYRREVIECVRKLLVLIA